MEGIFRRADEYKKREEEKDGRDHGSKSGSAGNQQRGSENGIRRMKDGKAVCPVSIPVEA